MAGRSSSMDYPRSLNDDDDATRSNNGIHMMQNERDDHTAACPCCTILQDVFTLPLGENDDDATTETEEDDTTVCLEQDEVSVVVMDSSFDAAADVQKTQGVSSGMRTLIASSAKRSRLSSTTSRTVACSNVGSHNNRYTSERVDFGSDAVGSESKANALVRTPCSSLEENDENHCTNDHDAEDSLLETLESIGPLLRRGRNGPTITNQLQQKQRPRNRLLLVDSSDDDEEQEEGHNETANTSRIAVENELSSSNHNDREPAILEDSSSEEDESSDDHSCSSSLRESSSAAPRHRRRRQPVRSTRLRSVVAHRRFQPQSIFDTSSSSSSGSCDEEDANSNSGTDESYRSDASHRTSSSSPKTAAKPRSVLQPISRVTNEPFTFSKDDNDGKLMMEVHPDGAADDSYASTDNENGDPNARLLLSGRKKESSSNHAMIDDLEEEASFVDYDDDDSIEDLTRQTDQLELNATSSDSTSGDMNDSFRSDSTSDDENGIGYAKKPNGRSPKKESRQAFARRRKALAEALLVQLDTKVFGGRLTAVDPNSPMRDSPVTLKWSKTLRTTAGRAASRQTTGQTRDRQRFVTIRYCPIELSTKVLDREDRLRDTLAHELCHAAQWLIDEKKMSHGVDFKRWGRRVTQAFPDIQITTSHSYEIHKKYAWKCSSCSTVARSNNRARVDPTRHVCGKCGGTFVPQFGPPKPLTAYQVFVQQHRRTKDGNVRSMQEIALLWRHHKERLSS